MKAMKKIMVMLLCAAMLLAFAACGNESTTEPQQTAAQPSEQPGDTAAPETSEAPETPETEAPELSEEEAWKLEPAYGQTLYYWVADSCVSAPIVADELGYYEEAGLTVEGFKGDSDVEALGTATAHVAVGHIAKQLVPATNGVDLVFVGGAHKGCKSLYVLGDSQFESTADLKGQKIAVPNGIGNSDYNITARLLDADGIDPLKDVSLVQVDNGACVAAMQNGELGAALLGDTYAYDMLKNGTLRKVRSMLDEDLDQICCVIGMNGTFVKENPITAKKLASCVRKALKWMNENPEEATQMLLDLGLSSGEFEKNLEINKSLHFGLDDDYAQAELKDLIDDYLRIGLITSDMDADEIMDMVWMPTGSAD